VARPDGSQSDSWEGWYWGGEHVWGYDWANGTPDQFDMLEDVMKYSDFLVFWSYDIEQSGWVGGQDKSQWLLWLKELGKKMVFISPDCSYTAATKGINGYPFALEPMLPWLRRLPTSGSGTGPTTKITFTRMGWALTNGKSMSWERRMAYRRP